MAPHRNLIGHLQKLTARKAGACSGLRFMDLRQLARRILILSGSTVAPELDRIARDLVIRQVVRQQLSDIEKAFGARVALTPAFMGAVTKTLSDLREAGITVEQVADLAGKKQGLSSVRLKVVADLFASYQDRLDSIDAPDDEGMFAMSVGLLKNGAVALPGRIYVYGIYDLTAGQNSLLDTLMDKTEVEQFVPVYPETEVYSGQLLKKWRSLAGMVESEIETSNSSSLTGIPLDELWATLSSEGRERDCREKGSTVTVVSAPGKSGEIDSALRLVAAAWQGGINRDETRLASVSPDSCQVLFSQKLESNGFRRHSTVEPAEEEDPADQGIDRKSAALQLVRAITDIISEEGIEIFSYETGESLDPLISDLPDTALWTEWADIFDPILTSMFDPAMLDRILDMLERLRRLSVTGEPADRAALRWALGRIVQDIRADDAIPLEGIMELRGTRSELVAVMGMAEGSWPSRPLPDPLLMDDERDILNVGDDWKLAATVRRKDEERLLFRLLIESGRHIVFLYPRINEQGGVRRASPHVLELMQQVVGKELPQEQLEMMARRNTRAVGAIRPPAGEPRLGELDRDLTSIAEAIDDGNRSDLYALWECPQFRAGFRMEQERWRGKPGPYAGFLISRDAVDKALKMLKLTGEGHVSVSLLEEYARCPWRVLTTRVLGLKEEGEPDGLLSGAEMGQVLHDVLRDYVKRASEDGRWPPAAGQAETDSTLVAEMVRRRVADEYAGRGTRFPPLERVDSRRATARLLGWLLWEASDNGRLEGESEGQEEEGNDRIREIALETGAAGGWLSHSVEQSFETELEIAGRSLKLRGRWDRIDRDASDRFRILDYKTGYGKSGPSADLEGGLNLQMPLYLMAAEKELDLSGSAGPAGPARSTSAIAGGILLRLPLSASGHGPHITSWPQQVMDAGRKEVERLVNQLLTSIESGVFTRLPHDRATDSRTDLCKGCPTPSICRAWRIQESQRHLKSDELLPLNVARKIGVTGGQSDG